MLTIDPKELNTKELHGYLMGSVGPRPIALASTVDEMGRPNLSPFSFFNVFSANPPIAIFSPARRSRDNRIKHTLENASETKEVVINLVSYNIVQQMSLSSSEFSKGVNEFTKSGFTPIPSDMVKPFRVKESPVQLECTIKDIVSMGDEGGAGNLVICEIVKMHISEQVLDANKQIDPHKIDLVGRMGGNWYCRASGDSIFKIEKPGGKKGIGFDGLPKRILNSFILTGNDLAKLAGVEVLPTTEDVNRYKENTDIAHILHTTTDDEEAREELHYHAKALLEENKIVEAWSTLLIDKLNRV
ncbi:MAG: flavin reductase family protein [Flavobacteriales bacterium]|nr:flavin reductase family protein [Flavobacteriales bacterium]